jgi:predicted Fe-Mo cluster-binding NifX family protein
MIGGNAREVLVAAGIALYTYNGGGSVDDALEQFRANALERAG